MSHVKLGAHQADNYTMSPATHAAPGPQVRPAEPEPDRQLGAIDDDLARQAEEALRLGLGEEFELEGEFLSQEEIAQVMAAESGGPEQRQTEASVPAGEHVQPAMPHAGPVEVSPRAAAADEPGVSRDASAATAAPLDASAVVPEPEPGAAKQPGQAVGASPAITPVTISDDIESLIGGAIGPPGQPAAVKTESATESPPAVVSPDHGQPAMELDIGGNELLESVTIPISALPMPRWQRMIANAASAFDRPWASLSRRAKNILGLVGVALLLIGVVLWTMGPIEIPRRAEAGQSQSPVLETPASSGPQPTH